MTAKRQKREGIDNLIKHRYQRVCINNVIKGIHLDLDTWIVPGQIPTGKPPPGSGKQ